MAGDLLFELKLVELSILAMLFILFIKGSLGELRSRYLEFKESFIIFFKFPGLSILLAKCLFSMTDW